MTASTGVTPERTTSPFGCRNSREYRRIVSGFRGRLVMCADCIGSIYARNKKKILRIYEMRATLYLAMKTQLKKVPRFFKIDADVEGELRERSRLTGVVSIPDVAVKWLAGHPLRSGPVTPSESTLRRCKRKARAILGWWQADCLRHTALSYHLALVGDVGKVATMAGNSPKVLLTHYNGLASKEAAEQFFKV